MPSDTIQELLRERVSSDAVAVKYGDQLWTWREHLRDASTRAAALLALADHGRPVHVGVLLAAQPDLSPKAWPRYVRITADLPTTATHKVLKRELAAQGPISGDGELWVREPRGTRYEREG